MARPKTLRPADFAVMTTAVLLNVRHDLATPADQHPMMAPGPVRVVHRGDVLAQPEISADTAPSPTPNRTSTGNRRERPHYVQGCQMADQEILNLLSILVPSGRREGESCSR